MKDRMRTPRCIPVGGKRTAMLVLVMLVPAYTIASRPSGTIEDNTHAAGKDISELNTGIRVCLDPGHPSFEDDKLFEAIINRKVAYYLEACLVEKGFSVLITVQDIPKRQILNPYFDNEGEQEQAMLQVKTPEERAELCNRWEGDYFLSIHHNYAYDPSTNHSLVLYHSDENEEPCNEESEMLGEMIRKELARTMEVDDAELNGDNALLGESLIVLKNTAMTAILTEASFYSNPEERERLNDDGYLRKEARAICRAFVGFIKKRN